MLVNLNDGCKICSAGFNIISTSGFYRTLFILYGALDTDTLNRAYSATADQVTLTPIFNMQDAPCVKLI